MARYAQSRGRRRGSSVVGTKRSNASQNFLAPEPRTYGDGLGRDRGVPPDPNGQTGGTEGQGDRLRGVAGSNGQISWNGVTHRIDQPITDGFACMMCGHEATLFVGDPRWSKNHYYCGQACCDALEHLLIKFGREFNFMALADLTEMERVAIRDARKEFATALHSVGLLDRFRDCSADQMDAVIEAIWNGLRASMQRQSLNDEIPF